MMLFYPIQMDPELVAYMKSREDLRRWVDEQFLIPCPVLVKIADIPSRPTPDRAGCVLATTAAL